MKSLFPFLNDMKALFTFVKKKGTMFYKFLFILFKK